jgi:hypothetical protein
MSGVLETIEGIVAERGDPDDVLRSVMETLADEPGISSAGVVFLEEGGPIPGPQAGDPNESRRICVPISYDGNPVAEVGRR